MKNKYQEAFEKIDNLLFQNRNYLRRDYKTLKEIVDKATPMKLLKSQIDGYRECGKCNSIIVSTNHDLPSGEE